jgi:hypothetical protein
MAQLTIRCDLTSLTTSELLTDFDVVLSRGSRPLAKMTIGRGLTGQSGEF